MARHLHLKHIGRAGLSSLKLGFLIVLLGLTLLLSGCVQADLGITISGQAGGKIQQLVRLAKPDRTILSQLQTQARKLGGSSHIQDNTTLELTIPFNRAEELAETLDQLLQPLANNSSGTLPPIPNHATVDEQNWLLFIRGRFHYDLDLRGFGLAAQAEPDSLVLSPGQLLSFRISLETPWGARGISTTPPNIPTPNQINPDLKQTGHRLLWTLSPGYFNHLEAVYLYPSGMGWGSLAIIGLMIGTWYWQRRSRPSSPETPQQSQ